MTDFRVTYQLDVFDVDDERGAAEQAAETLLHGFYTAARSVYTVQRAGSQDAREIDLSGENEDRHVPADAGCGALRRIAARMPKVWATFEDNGPESRHQGIDVDALVLQLDGIGTILARAGITWDPRTGEVMDVTGACGVEGCTGCLPLFDPANNPIPGTEDEDK